MLNIVHMTSVHFATDVRILHKQCKTLAKAGYKVTLIACAHQDSSVDGVIIKALPMPKNRFDRMLRIQFYMAKACIKEKADVYHFHDLELIPLGWLLKLMGKKVIYDVHEDNPVTILSKHYLPRRLRSIIANLVKLIEKISSRYFDKIVAVTPTIAAHFNSTKVVLIRNFPIIEEFNIDNKNYHDRDNTVLYAGGISYIRGIETMLAAMHRLPPKMNAKLYLAGEFKMPNLHEQVKIWPGWEKAVYLGFLSRTQLATISSQVRIGIVTLHPNKNYIESYPTKLFEYMAAALPVIASDFPLWREIVVKNGCGLVVDPMKPFEIANAIKYLLSNPEVAKEMGRKGFEAVRQVYSWRTEEETLLNLYRQFEAEKRLNT